MILDDLIVQIEAGEHPDLPRDIEMKYQAWSGGQFSKLTIIYLEKLSDRVTKMESQLKEAQDDRNSKTNLCLPNRIETRE